MPAITLHFDGLNEERKRERRRAFAILAAGVLLAVLGIGAAFTDPPPPTPVPPRVIIKEVPKPYPVEVTKTETTTVVERVVVKAPPEHIVILSPGRHIRDIGGAGVIERIGPDSLHLCLSPKWLYLKAAATEHVIVSNPGGGPLTVTNVSFVSDRAVTGFTIDGADCEGKTLAPGERCTIDVTLRNRIGETLQLLVSHGDHAESMVIQAPEDYRLAATTSGFSSRESKNSTIPR